MKTVFVIIVTYKGHQWYERCFTSLRNSEYPVQTIVIDNASNDGTVEYIREHFPEIHLIESKENLGFGRANNLGMRYALDHGCDYVFLLNQDTWIIQNDIIEQLIDLSEESPKYGILSPMHLIGNEEQLSIQYENRLHECGRKMLSDLYCGMLKDMYETDYVNAAAWLIPRKVLEIVGGFNPLFYLYGEDDDFINRIHYHGMKVAVCPKIKVIHDHVPFSNRMINNSCFTEKKELLVQLLDINKREYTSNYMRYCIKKIVLSFIKFDRTKISYWWNCYKYVRKTRNDVIKYRMIAEQGNFAWI